MRQLALKVLNLSHASYSESLPCWENEVIFALNLAILPEGKYLLRKALDKASQVVNEVGSSLRSQSLALSVSEKRKSLSLIVSAETLLSLIVSHFTRKLRRWMCGFSVGRPLNWSFSTKDTIVGRSFKLFALTAGLTMEEAMLVAYGKT